MATPPPAAPAQTLDLYSRIATTAAEFIEGMEMDPEVGELDADAVLAARHPDCRASWGHNYMKTVVRPGLNEVLDNDGFLAHTAAMVPLLHSVKTKITDLVVDERARRAVARVSFYMTPKGAHGPGKETVENDIVFVLSLDEDALSVTDAIEFIDGEATKRLGELLLKAQRKVAHESERDAKREGERKDRRADEGPGR